MSNLNIDGSNVKFKFTFHGDGIIQQKVIGFLESNTAFILHDGSRNNGMIIIPEKLICIHFGEVLFHKGVTEFQFTLSFYVGLYSCADTLDQNEISYRDRKLLNYAATNEGHTP